MTAYPILFGESETVRFGKHEFRMISVNGTPWFALPDLIDAMGLEPKAADVVDGPDFPDHAKLFSDEEPTVALEEGQSLTEIAEKLGAKMSTASKHMLDLGERNRRKQPGYKLVSRKVDPMNLRVSRYTLTQKGKLLAQSVAEIMEE